MNHLFYQFLKRPFFGRYMVRWQNPLPPAEECDWTSFTIASNSGGTLHGRYRTSATNPVGTIVLAHPMGKEAKGYFLKNGYADLYNRCGLNVVLFDFNGFGESSHGNFSYFEDILASANYARRKFPQGPLFYHGISFGALWGIIAFTHDHPFDFVILESSPTTLEEFWKRFPVAYITLRLFSFVMPRYARKIRMIDRVSELKRICSMLLVYSETDTYVPISMGAQIAHRSNVATTLWTIPQAEHIKIVKSEFKEIYFERLAQFIAESFAKKPVADSTIKRF